MTDQVIVDALIARDEQVTAGFFFGHCRPLFVSVIRNLFSYEVDYDEFVNELYLHLMENDAYRLRQFKGRSTIYQWLKVVAIRYFMARRDCMIDMLPRDTHLDIAECKETAGGETETAARIDVENLLLRISNRRYVHVIRRLILQDAEPEDVARELGTNVNNLYNIKKRAIAALADAALKDVERYGKETAE